MTNDDPLGPDGPLTPDDDDQALAAELALGLLDGDEAQEAVARLSRDPDFAHAVRDWQERLAALAEDLTPVMAPARARQSVRQRLGHATAPLETDPMARRPWWRGPFGALTGLLAVAGIAAVLWLPPLQQQSPPGYQADLVVADSDMRVGARIAGRELEVALQSGSPSAGRDLEIWWIDPDGRAPVSMGVVPRDGRMLKTLPAGMEPSPQVQIALSDEPEGGSPTGQATGAVVAIATLTSL